MFSVFLELHFDAGERIEQVELEELNIGVLAHLVGLSHGLQHGQYTLSSRHGSRTGSYTPVVLDPGFDGERAEPGTAGHGERNGRQCILVSDHG